MNNVCACCGKKNDDAVRYFFGDKPATHKVLCFTCADERPEDPPTNDDDVVGEP